MRPDSRAHSQADACRCQNTLHADGSALQRLGWVELALALVAY
eukprot:COSAG02_NODE_61670_length_268_cov_0.603550_2_plen_42_part_01